MKKYTHEAWFKLQSRMFESSIWEEDLATRVVWITLLALAQTPENMNNGPGMVLITPGNLMRKALVTKEELEHSLTKLVAPDSMSRSETPRLEILPNGYRIPAFEKYNDYERWERFKERARKGGEARMAKEPERDESGKFLKGDAE